MAVTKKKVFKRLVMPEYYPRLKNLLGSGFGNLSYFIAVVYNMVRILPNNHPYLKKENHGKFSTLNVIAEAANNIALKKQNIDQIIVFFSILMAIGILFAQIFLLLIYVIIPKSQAQGIPDNVLEFFVTPAPDSDLAFQLLNLVFGIPEFFGGADDITLPIHNALHALFEFYSIGILIVGTFIILYMVVTTMAETAQSGIPFGRRFNKTWTPIRIVLFFALLLPITLGINSAQYITLLSAKLGSGLATQGWILYNQTVLTSPGGGGGEGGGDYTLTGRTDQNVALPKKEDLMHLPAYMTVIKTCAFSYEDSYNEETFPESWEPGPLAWAIFKDENNNWQARDFETSTFAGLIDESEGQEIFVVFGVRDPELYQQYSANIVPLCGTLNLRVTDASQPGAEIIRNLYYDMIKSMWIGDPEFTDGVLGDNIDPNDADFILIYQEIDEYAREFQRLGLTLENPAELFLPDYNHKIGWAEHIDLLLEGPDGISGVIKHAVDTQVEEGNWNLEGEITNLGWVGAAIWYNKIAEQNGALVSALRNSPQPVLYPRVLERVEQSNRSENRQANPLDRFTISFAADTPAIFVQEYEKQIARATNYAFTYWNDQDTGDSPITALTGNAFLDIVNTVLGTQGLFELCRNTDIHPLAQLSAVGKSMLDNSISAFGGSALFGLFGIQPLFKATTSSLSEFFGTIANVGLLIGFVLFYVLPFMPFIYFFFATGSWVKSIFEAMVAMPLWALAHLRIDGEGVMGDAAMGGYYLIFEIFIRPILIIFGLLAAIMIFATMVKGLNQVFYIVVSNVSGHDPKTSTGCFTAQANGVLDPGQIISTDVQQAELEETYRGPIDEFFFTIVYAIVVYIIGTGCFKLIDEIPNNILRWLSAEVSSFGDNAGAEAGGLMKYATLGGQRFGQQLGSSIQGVGSGLKESTSQGIDKAVAASQGGGGG